MRIGFFSLETAKYIKAYAYTGIMRGGTHMTPYTESTGPETVRPDPGDVGERADPKMRSLLRGIRNARTWGELDLVYRDACREIVRRENAARAFREAVSNTMAETVDRLHREEVD